MGKGFGIAALVIAFISVSAFYGFNMVLVWMAMICACIAILNGERPFSIAATVVGFVGLLVLSPVTMTVVASELDCGKYGVPFMVFGPFILPIAAFIFASVKKSNDDGEGPLVFEQSATVESDKPDMRSAALTPASSSAPTPPLQKPTVDPSSPAEAGAPIATIACPKCTAPNDLNARFCNSCGGQLSSGQGESGVKYRTGDNNIEGPGASPHEKAMAFAGELFQASPSTNDGQESDSTESFTTRFGQLTKNLASQFASAQGRWIAIGIGAGLVAVVALVLLYPSSKSPGIATNPNAAAPVVVYATRPVIVRNAPTTSGSQIITTLARSSTAQGNWVTGSDGTSQWLQIASGNFQGNFISGGNLSPWPRPAMVRSLDRDMTIRQPARLLPLPNAVDTPIDTVNVGLVVHVAGEVEGGWMEIQRRAGGVGYLPTQAFEVPQESATAAPQQAGQFHYIVGLDPEGDNWLGFRSEPAFDRGVRLKKLEPATLFTLLRQEGDWAQIQLQSGETGWVYSRFIACCKRE